MTLDALGGEGFVQTAPPTLEPAAGDGTGAEAGVVANTPPSGLQIVPVAATDENGIADLLLSFTDPDANDTHTIEVNWGDGTPVETFHLAAGNRLFGTSHQYLDDDPSGTAVDLANISVTVSDNNGGMVAGGTTVQVSNVAPRDLIVSASTDVDENGYAVLALVFADPGTLDGHVVEVDWGDGTAMESFSLSTGSRFLLTTHQYLDDNPTGTPFDVNTIDVRVIDDDGGVVAASSPIRVDNLAPSQLVVQPIAPIDENGVATLDLSFADPGTLDAHTVEIDWGDGTAVEIFTLSAGARQFSTTHQYLDDNPAGTPVDDYAVQVRVIDDDGGEVSGATTARVRNVPPSQLVLTPPMTIDENGTAALGLSFVDPGTLDTYTVEIDWGDGSPLQTIAVSAGTRSLAAMHQYLDDNPSGTAADLYVVSVRVIDDDGGEAFNVNEIEVANVPPRNLVLTPIADIDENGAATLDLSFDDPGTLDSHTVEVDWGDGSPVQTFALAAGQRTFSANHQYLDDNPSGTTADLYSIRVVVRDDDSGAAMAETSFSVRNVPPMISRFVIGSGTHEGDEFVARIEFSDPGSLDGHDVEIDWGDGFVTTGAATGRSFTASHVYADDGNYTATARVVDDDGGTGTAVTSRVVTNVAPTLAVAASQTVDEGSLLSITDIGTFTDPGFDNPLNTNDPSNGGEVAETFTYSIDWGDGTPLDTGSATVDAPGSAGVLTAGSFDGSHTYADNGVYTVTVTVMDDDGGVHAKTFAVTVNNVAPTLAVAPPQSIDEGSLLSIADIGAFTDPGFDNPANTSDPGNGGEVVETFAYSIDWGDGTPLDTGTATIDAPGSAGVLTAGSFDGSHAYADNGVYTVTVSVFDDDGGVDAMTFEVIVLNVAPTLAVVGNQTIAEGALLSITDIGTFTDPGFDNPSNGGPGGNGDEVAETFTYEINWGDGAATVSGVAAIDTPGAPGALTAGSFNGQHVYADNGLYTVEVRVLDDDGGIDVMTFMVEVDNVAPSLSVVADQTIAEGSLLSLTDIGTFTDPGFDNPANGGPGGNGDEVAETFSYEINWGDGTAPDFGVALVDQPGSPGTLSSGSFDGQHTYADNGLYTVEVRVLDDDGGIDVKTFRVQVTNVDPTLAVVADQMIAEGSVLSLPDIGNFTDPGFDNPDNTVDPGNGGETEETFTYEINWGDGTAPDFGFASIDAPGSIGVKTAGSFDGQHIFADDGLYTVEVRILDDDGGIDIKTFQVLVTNVDPALTGIEGLVVDEGQAFTLAGLGVGLTDPGFDNLLNTQDPANGGETTETFSGFTVDWGDGTAIDSLSVVGRVSGSPGVATTAGFDHAPHTYADNGLYAVTLRLADDDGGVVTRTLQVLVSNVDPTLTLTDAQFTLNEGETLTIPDLATFSDPGFDNLANAGNASNGGETTELFTYTIDWGDGTPVESFGPGDMVRTSGSPGVLTAGSFGGSHFYADNDADNKYTVTVTLHDDDGGVDVRSIEVTVLNVNPALDPIAATDVSALGVTVLNLTFSDPGADSFEVLVDWGDKLSLPPDARFVVETVHAGPTPQSFTLSHKYSGPPDPVNPAADITIRVKIQDDDFGNPIVIQAGESNLEFTVITNPGEGKEAIYIDTTPQVPRLEFVPRDDGAVFVSTAANFIQARTGFDQRGAAGDAGVGSERYFELRVIYANGSMSDGYRLPNDAINDIPGLFRTLPDNHYAIYLVQPQTGSRRLVIEVFVRNGKLIDPGDDSEGARDRPPSDDAAPQSGEEQLAPLDQVTQTRRIPPLPLTASAATPLGEETASAPRTIATPPMESRDVDSSEDRSVALPLAAAGLAISSRGRLALRAQQRKRSAAERRQKLLTAVRGGRARPR